jgi:hypothetical protein
MGLDTSPSSEYCSTGCVCVDFSTARRRLALGSHLSVRCYSVDDVYAFSEKLEKAGCVFQKKPDEGT